MMQRKPGIFSTMWVFFVGYVWDTVGYCGICVDIMLETSIRGHAMPDTISVQPASSEPSSPHHASNERQVRQRQEALYAQ